MKLVLTKKDLEHETGNQAVVLSKNDFDRLGSIEFVHASGEIMMIESESLQEGDVLILYPHELGNEE